MLPLSVNLIFQMLRKNWLALFSHQSSVAVGAYTVFTTATIFTLLKLPVPSMLALDYRPISCISLDVFVQLQGSEWGKLYQACWGRMPGLIHSVDRWQSLSACVFLFWCWGVTNSSSPGRAACPMNHNRRANRTLRLLSRDGHWFTVLLEMVVEVWVLYLLPWHLAELVVQSKSTTSSRLSLSGRSFSVHFMGSIVVLLSYSATNLHKLFLLIVGISISIQGSLFLSTFLANVNSKWLTILFLVVRLVHTKEDTDVEVPGFFFVKLAVFWFVMDVGQVFLHIIDLPFRSRLEYQIRESDIPSDNYYFF